LEQEEDMSRFARMTGYVSILTCVGAMLASLVAISTAESSTFRNCAVTFHCGVFLASVCFVEWMGVLRRYRFFAWSSLLMWIGGGVVIVVEVILGGLDTWRLGLAVYATVMLGGRVSLLATLSRVGATKGSNNELNCIENTPPFSNS
jgi:hypothetical protein